MRLAFTIFKYFPFGGLQRDCLEIARTCQQRGHEVTLYTMEWQGPAPGGLTIQILPTKGFTNHGRCNSFVKAVMPRLQSGQFDAIVGFNKMPGLDLYYAGDSCYQARARLKHRWEGPFYWMTPRFRRYVALEKAVFDPRSQAEIILLAPEHRDIFARQYSTPCDRFHVMPPGIGSDRQPSPRSERVREEVRKEFLGSAEKILMLMVGSEWKGKGFDRTARAIASLPEGVRNATRLVAIGETRRHPYARMAEQFGIGNRVSLLSPREDIARYFLGADLFVHPAYNDNTGGVILESMLYGLPVLTTDVCGYAQYVSAAQAGVVLPSPFRQETMNRALLDLAKSPHRQVLGKNAQAFVQKIDLYARPSRVAELIESRAERNRGTLHST